MEKKQETEEEKLNEKLKIWSSEQFTKEYNNLIAKKPAEAIYVPLKVIHMSAEIEASNKHINRVEFDEIHDFSLVKEILVSKEIKCLLKPGYFYVTVILWFDKETYMMFPYVYKEKVKGKGKNTLKQWTFINKNMQEANHVISSYKQN